MDALVFPDVVYFDNLFFLVLGLSLVWICYVLQTNSWTILTRLKWNTDIYKLHFWFTLCLVMAATLIYIFEMINLVICEVGHISNVLHI